VSKNHIWTFDLREVEGFGPTLCARVKGEFPLDEWRDSPYELAKVHGVGFRRADAVALRLGVGKDSKERLNAATWHVLGESEMAGNTAMPIPDFGKALADCLQISLPNSLDFDDSIYEADGLISRRATRDAEMAVATQMRVMMDRALHPNYSSKLDGLAEDQRAALLVIETANIFALMGGPGVGKTYLVKRIAESSARVELCAPTGKAAKRIEELSGQPTQTIHRLLGVVPPHSPLYHACPRSHSGSKFRFKHHRANPLKADLVICDEASMLDVKLAADLCDALGDARLILVGDPFQLPSVGSGAVLRDLTTSQVDGHGGPIPNMELTELKRQNPSLLIARTCKSIRFDKHVIIDNESAQDFFFIPTEGPIDAQRLIVEMATERIPAKYGLDASEVMVLAPLRDKGPLSAEQLNVVLRAKLNPEGARLSHLPWTGDRVIQKSNDYAQEIYNGDTGTIVEATPSTLRILFDTPCRELAGDRSDFDLGFAYALTTHRFQGSESSAVVVAIDGSGPAQYLCDAQWLYTSLSRAREVCVAIGSRKALDAMAAKHRAVNRWTRLATMMRQ
jgi:exodeoxyribonuclease V alpha subunit